MSSGIYESVQALCSEIWLSQDLNLPVYLYLSSQVIRIILFALEYGVSRYKGIDNFCAQEFGVNLLMHVGERISGVIWHGLLATMFIFTYEHRLLDLRLPSLWGFLWGLLIVDFAYYLTHRWMHEFRLGWATHMAHHTPTKFNLSISYRLGISPESSLGWVPALIVPLLGIAPMQGTICFVVTRLYQYWVHTELLPEMRWFGILFVTPAHHRVHHANAPEYMNRNYGGVLIIFDKMFGTFAKENKAVPLEYGLFQPLPTKTFLGIGLYGWRELIRDIVEKRSLWVLLERTPAAQYEDAKRSQTLKPYVTIDP